MKPRGNMESSSYNLIEVKDLLHPEFYSPKRVYSLYRKIKEDGVWTAALYVDNKYNIVLDGQHRLEVAKLMNLKRVPAIFFDLESKKTRVWSEKGKEKINKKLLIKRAQGYEPYPYKSIDFDHADKYDGNACRVGFELLR